MVADAGAQSTYYYLEWRGDPQIELRYVPVVACSRLFMEKALIIGPWLCHKDGCSKHSECSVLSEDPLGLGDSSVFLNPEYPTVLRTHIRKS